MKVSPELLQFLGSLFAILAVAGLAWWLGLGGQTTLGDEADARTAANDAVDGYTAVETAIDAKGNGAIMQDQNGRILVLKLHGNKFAGRILTQTASAELKDGALTVISGEQRYGAVTLSVDHPQTWVDRINALENTADA